MEKTDLMLKYEKETRETLDMAILAEDASGSWYGYIDMVDKKAAAYDRLMSGKEKMTLKELANFKGFPITIDSDWTIKSHGAEPKMVEMPHGAGFWVNDADDEEEIDESFVEIPDDFDWTTSLTLPDGWEEK